MQPSEKSKQVDDTIKKVFGVDRVGSIEADRCAWCGGDATKFRDYDSRREYSISGLCQRCQDKTFGPAAGDD